MSSPGAAGKGASASRSEATPTSESFPRSARITSRRSYLHIYEQGQRVSGPYFVVFGLPGGGTRTRLGITATRKCGGSVVRNRLKRVVREVFRRRAAAGAIPIDLVVNVKPSAAAATYEALAGDLCRRLDDLERRFSA